MKHTLRKWASLMLSALLCLSALPAALAEETAAQPELVARVKEIIEVDGYQFKDLNANGELDPYEDWRLTPEERAEDLLGRMDATQKAAQMVHLTLVSKKDDWFNESNVGFALVYQYIFDSAAEAAQRTNEIQELSESAPLGIPVIFSMDTEAGAAFVKDATFLPDEINQGAVGDPELVAQLNEVLRTELMAVGVRMALSPDADLITDPRWGRNQECYSEDTDVVQTLIVAAVQALPGRARFVTRDGVVCWPNGKVTAGSAVRSSEGVLARQHRLEQLSELVPQAREAAAAASRAADEAAQKLATSREQASRASREKAQAAGRAESLEREASRFAASLDAERRDRAAIDRQREDLTRQAQAQQPLKSELEQRIQTLEQEAADLEERISVSAQEQRSRLSDEQARERRASELKVEVATLKERQRSLDRRIGELSSSRERAERSLASSAYAERTLGVACGRIGPLLTLLRELGEQAGERVKLVQDRQRLQEASSSSLAEAIAGIRETVDAARTRHNGVVAAQNELKVERARLETKVEAAVQHIVGDLNVPLETALEVRTPVDRQVDEDRARQLAAQIAGLGPVNQVAQEEYARLKARDEYISAQVADLEGARKALTRIVNAIDRKMRQSFLETFEVVNTSFQEIFSRFFPGGQGSLVLTDPDNPDQTGIELDVQPKGKHIRRTQLMSGGEQALISIALLFAVYRTRSVPFFILDEVEPALDDTNLRRLTGFLDDMRHSTQLIMITHQRRTMELADVLYGVSMQADGVSKLVSQRLDGNGHWVEDPSNNPQAPQGQQSRR